MKRSLIFITLLLITAIWTASVMISAGCNMVRDTASAVPATSAAPTMFRHTARPVEEARPTYEIKENDVASAGIEEETEIMYYTEEEVVMMAKLLYRECGGIPSDTEKACVAWCVCNRVDSDEFDGDTIAYVMTAPNQFAYVSDTPVRDDLYDLALDVLSRWNAERNGEVSVGRVLPKDYTYFHGDGSHNHFRNAYKGNYSTWDHSLPSPYES